MSDLLKSDCKFIIFAHHLVLLDAVEEETQKNNVKYIRIDGQTNAEMRHAGVKRFQIDSTVRVAILALAAAGVGITLTAASTIVMAEMSWTPGVMIQAEDRAHRIG